jgi:sodium-dependent dicarboxylate transporter 2/3/5
LDVTIVAPTSSQAGWERAAVAITLAITVGLWLTAPVHGIPMAVVSFLPPCALAAVGVLQADDVRALPWDVLILLAGGLSLGVTVEVTGLAAWLAARFDASALHPALLALAVSYATMLASNLMSNTAAASVAVPMSLAFAVPEHHAMVAASVALSASAAMCLPISTPPNALAHGSGRLRSRELLAAGGLLGLAAPPLAVGWAWLTLG